MATVTLTNQQTTFAADTNADVSVTTNAGNADDGTQRVVLASDQVAIATKADTFSTFGTNGQVTATATSAEKVASNSSRKYLALRNTSTSESAHLNHTTATTSHWIVRPGETWVAPAGFTGPIHLIRGGSVDVTFQVLEG